MTTEELLTRDEAELLLSLPDSELTEFLESISPENVQTVIRQLQEIESSSSTLTGNYKNDRSQYNAERINAQTAAAQEVGPLPGVADPDRRQMCSADNLLFAETYFASTFYLPWAPYQRSMMDRFQDVIFNGGKECHAVRRGGLKSTCARVSCLWAVLNGHRRFAVLVGATDSKAREHRQNLFDMMAASELLQADFPELAPMLLKWRQPKKQLRLGGRLLRLSPKDTDGRIIFPDIPGSPAYQSRVYPFSMDASDVSGLSYVGDDGVTHRPDLVIYDDVQTPQSARSPSMTDKREDMIIRAFGGLAGVGQNMAEIMVCTVRGADCLSTRFLSRKRHPDWNGVKYKSLLKMPTRTDLWDKYGAALCLGETPAEGKAIAQSMYERQRSEMDAGGEVAWDHDKQADEISALQSLMTVRYLKPEFFASEIQQEGELPPNSAGIRLDAESIMQRVSQVPRGVVPEHASYLTAFVDSSDMILWWVVCAWAQDFTGWVVDYGTWPDQGRPTFQKSDLAARLVDEDPGKAWEESFVIAHRGLETFLLREWPDSNGTTRQVDLLLKDWSDGQHKPRIESQVMASPDRNRIRPSKGSAPRPGRKPVHLWGDQHRDRNAGSHWVERRSETPNHVQYDANHWKTTVAHRLLTTPGAPSALLLPGSDPMSHRLIAEHCTAEIPRSMTVDGASGIIWDLIPARDNDWWDCIVGNAVAASMLGCGIVGEKPSKPERRIVKLPRRR